MDKRKGKTKYNGRIITVYTTDSAETADRIRSLLNTNRIMCLIQNPVTLRARGLFSGTMVGVYRILIMEKYYDQSVALIKEYLETEKKSGAKTTRKKSETVSDEAGRSVLLAIFWIFGFGSLLAIIVGIKSFLNDYSTRATAVTGIILGIIGLVLAVIWKNITVPALIFIVGLFGVPVYFFIFGVHRYFKTGRPLYCIIFCISGFWLLAALFIIMARPF